MRAGDAVRWAGGIAFVLAVDPVRKRALLALDAAPGRRWEWLSMLTPLPLPAVNPLLPFLAARCVLAPGLWIVSAELRAAYLDFCRETERPALGWGAYGNPATVRQALLALGIHPALRWVGPSRRRSKVRVWKGIALR